LRRDTPRWRNTRRASLLAGWLSVATVVAPSVAAADSGGAGLPLPAPAPLPLQTGGGRPATGTAPTPSPGALAALSADRRTAVPPVAAPEPIKQAISAANRITRKPYIWGGGHGSFRSRGYDCSGAVSYVLHGAGALATPLDSSDLMRWGDPGTGAWITVYTNRGHAFAVIAGLRFDTSGPGERGPRWRIGARSSRSFTARHPAGF
jgi:cell wall-associated NlpC family hydrolase